MMKRSLFLALAAGLLASLVFAAPTQAASIALTHVVFNVTPAGATAADFEITYALGTAPGPVTFLPTTTVPGATSIVAGDKVTINFTPTNNGVIDFTFNTPLNPPLTFLNASLTGVTQGATGNLAVLVTTIPEPASMALLGIGMAGFLAFRRLFKRSSAA